jgi:hypothetical protein
MESDDNGYYQEGAHYGDGYYGDGYYDEGYHENLLESTLNYCVLPVIAQVTAVFLKLFGLAAIVSLTLISQFIFIVSTFCPR